MRSFFSVHTLVFALVALICAGSIVQSASAQQQQQQPGSLKFFIQNAGIEKVQSIVNPLLTGFLENMTVPDVTWSSLGIHMNLSSIHLSKFDFGTQTVTLVEPDQIVISMAGLSLITLMDWRYTDGPAIDWSGWAEDDVSNTNIKIVLVVGSDAEGHATLRVDSSTMDIGTLDIHLHGSGGTFVGSEIGKWGSRHLNLMNLPLQASSSKILPT
jgi:hypothetical protein